MHNEHCQHWEHNHSFGLLTCGQLKLKVPLPHSTSHTLTCTPTPSVCWHVDNSSWKYHSHTPPVTHWRVHPLLRSADMCTTAHERQDAEGKAFRTQPLLQSADMWTTQAERQAAQWTAFRTQPLLSADMWTATAERLPVILRGETTSTTEPTKSTTQADIVMHWFVPCLKTSETNKQNKTKTPGTVTTLNQYA